MNNIIKNEGEIRDLTLVTSLPSSRVVSDVIEAMSIQYNTRVYEMKHRGEDITVLSLGEAYFDLPLLPFDDLPMPQVFHYSHSRGIPELRQCLADYFRDAYGVPFDPEQEILITAGSKVAIYMAMQAVLNPGDDVVICEPAWVSYPEQVKLCGAVPVMVPHHEKVFSLKNYITLKTKMLIINHPNNPQGSVYTVSELSEIHRLSKQFGFYILSDETYSDFVSDRNQFISLGRIDTQKSHTILVNSISKNFGISGWRLGYVIGNPSLIRNILKINQHLITCPATILEYYVAKNFNQLLGHTLPQIKSVLVKRAEIIEYMNTIGLSCMPGDATFYLFVSIEGSKLDSRSFCDELLEKYKVSTVPGVGYGKSCDRYIRVSVGTESMERIQRGLDLIQGLIQSTAQVQRDFDGSFKLELCHSQGD